MALLRGYRYRILGIVGILMFLLPGWSDLGRGPKYHGSALLDFETLSAFIGAYTGLAIASAFASYISDLAPDFKRNHLAFAFALQILVVAVCVAGTALLSSSEWSDVSYVKMFALLWGWCLIWFWGGCYGRGGILSIAALNMLLFAGSARLAGGPPRGVGELLWPLMQGRFTAADVIFPAFDVLFAFVLFRGLHERRGNANPETRTRFELKPPKAFENIPDDIGESLVSRIKHLKFGLPKDYWLIWLAATAAVHIYSRLRGHMTDETSLMFLYGWCFACGAMMIPSNALKREHLQVLFQLPLNRREIVRSYGLMLLLYGVRFWLGFVVVSYFALRVPLPNAAPISPSLDVWAYCLAIFLIMFGVRTLLGLKNDSLLYRIVWTLLIVDFASLSDSIVPSVAAAFLVGLSLIGASYYSWLRVEFD